LHENLIKAAMANFNILPRYFSVSKTTLDLSQRRLPRANSCRWVLQ